MKKNKPMRMASALLVLILLTTSMIGGTLAKYTTQDSASDGARVAKWGVSVTTSGSLFAATYAETDATVDNIDNSVISIGSDDVVAPGTSSGDGITFSITGKPEVAVDVNVSVTDSEGTGATATDVFLKKGTYDDLTSGNSSDKFTIESDYYPIKYTLKDSKNDKVIDGGKLSDIETYLENLSGRYAANTDLNEKYGTYVLTWEWAFEQNNDEADTFLGTLAANNSNEDSYCLKPDIKIAISVTQVD